jgi:cell wall-associated NlpC family hydrolase
MKKLIVLLGAGLMLLMAAPVLTGTAAVAALFGAGVTGVPALRESPMVPGTGGIPAAMLIIYRHAAAACPGLSWTILAAIGSIESNNDQSTLPGVHSGHNPAGAMGPMQFEPATFGRYDRPTPAGGVNPPSPYDPVDAAYAAARMLCADGAADAPRLKQAVFAYNHSDVYVTQVLQLALALGAGGQGSGRVPGNVGQPSGPAAVAAQYALAQVGTPYRWGGETPGVGFDCSGLVQAAWADAGVRLPRVAQDQFDAGPLLTPGSDLQAGDLVFFGPPGGGVTHVGLVVDPSGRMVDAPHPGAWVRVEAFPVTVGSGWGGDVYLGAARPGVN